MKWIFRILVVLIAIAGAAYVFCGRLTKTMSSHTFQPQIRIKKQGERQNKSNSLYILH